MAGLTHLLSHEQGESAYRRAPLELSTREPGLPMELDS